jgi:hypothetical protein
MRGAPVPFCSRHDLAFAVDLRARSVPKTQAGRRPVALDPLTVGVLRRHRQESARTSTPAAGTGGLVFCGPDSQPLHPERVHRAFRRALICHKLPTIPLHGLRHTWATIALQTGIHPRVVQERPGHSNICDHPADLLARAPDHARRRREIRRRSLHARKLRPTSNVRLATVIEKSQP